MAAIPTAVSAKLRLDDLLVTRGLFASRSRARDAILRGTVSVSGRPVTKPGTTVAVDAAVSVDDPAQRYVSRAALKLEHGLDRFGIDPDGRVALDIGASTGGFTEVLLARNAARVVAIDVGHGQMHPRVAADPRVANIEGLNARFLDADHLGGEAPTLVVCDASFISLRLVLPPALALAAPGADGLFLVKPQFEAGRDRIGKGGLVAPEVATEVAEELAAWLDEQPGWQVVGLDRSPIAGGDGNLEYLLAGRKMP